MRLFIVKVYKIICLKLYFERDFYCYTFLYYKIGKANFMYTYVYHIFFIHPFIVELLQCFPYVGYCESCYNDHRTVDISLR